MRKPLFSDSKNYIIRWKLERKIKFFRESYLLSEKSSNFATQSGVMSSIESLKIDLRDLKEGESLLEFDLDDGFFEAVDASEIRKGNLHATLSIYRTDDAFQLDFHTTGLVTVLCDLCLDGMAQPVETRNRLWVKFGEENSEEDELVVVDEDEGILDVAWLIYEFIDLSIPIRHVHAPGKCNPAMMKVLEEHSASRRGKAEEEKPVDPRWAALAKLKD